MGAFRLLKVVRSILIEIHHYSDEGASERVRKYHTDSDFIA